MEIKLFGEIERQAVQDFFDQMVGESKALFNRGRGNERSALAYFDHPDSDKNALRWSAIEDGRMVGYVFLWDIDCSVVWLGIAVSEDMKGKGLGKKLLAHCRDWAVSHGKGGILLTTHQANLRGQSLYEGFGFEKMGIHTSGEILYLLRFAK